MSHEAETQIDWTEQIAAIRRRFEAAIIAGQTVHQLDPWLRQVPDSVQGRLREELEYCISSEAFASRETQAEPGTISDDPRPPASPARYSDGADVPGILSPRDAIHGCETFRGLAQPAVQALEKEFQAQCFADGTVLLEQGQASRGLYLILHGQVDIDDIQSGQRIASDGAGSIMGEMSLLTNQPCSARVTATQNLEALVLSPDGYQRLKDQHPELEIALSQLVSDRLGGRPRDALCGKEISDYRLLQCISRGGMGVVYQAERIDDGQPVALKMMRHRFIYDDNIRTRFDQEAELLASLSHPNIISFREHFLSFRTRFLVLDLCDGSDLYRVLRRWGHFDESVARAVLGQIARGLRAAHDAGVIHRDLKPGNVLVDRLGIVKLTDFGLSKLIQAEIQEERAVGTPSYMPPEQFRGQDIGAPCDWYAMACLAYEMISGKPLFKSRGWFAMYEQKKSLKPSNTWPEMDASDEFRSVVTAALHPDCRQRKMDLEAISHWARPVPELFD